MKRLFLLPILMLGPSFAGSSFNCDSKVYDDYYKENFEDKIVDELIVGSTPIFNNGSIECSYGNRYQREDYNKVSRKEVGDIDGVLYRIYYSDGSGSIQGLSSNKLTFDDKYSSNWSTRCDVDEITDEHSCSISKEDIAIIIKGDRSYVLVGKDHYPGSESVVRIDKGTPIKTNNNGVFSLDDSRAIIEKLKTGSEIVTRYMEWPNKYNKDKKWEIYGFPQAWEVINKINEVIAVD